VIVSPLSHPLQARPLQTQSNPSQMQTLERYRKEISAYT
jgi:hypothetical protein